MASTSTSHVQVVPEELELLDESLRCSICKDLYNVAVTVADRQCGHSFCSECIRNSFREGLKSMKRQASCPQCRHVVPSNVNVDSVLIPNRALQESVLVWREYKKKWAATNPETTKKSSRSLRNRREVDVAATATATAADTAADTVAPQPVLKRRASTRYSGMKKKQLQALCKQEGLSTQGMESELNKRHQEFITLWNSQTDSIAPKTPSEMVKIIKQRERSQKEERLKEYSNGTNNHGKYLETIHRSLKKKGEGEDTQITSGCPDFDNQLKDNFAMLTKQLKQRRKASKQGSSTVEDSSVDSKKASAALASAEIDENRSVTEQNESRPKSLKNDASVNDITNKIHSKSSPVVSSATESSATESESSETPISKPPLLIDLVEDTLNYKHKQSNTPSLERAKDASASTPTPTPTSTSTSTSTSKTKKSPKSIKSATPKASLSQSKLSAKPQEGKKRERGPPVDTDSSHLKRRRNHRSVAGPWECNKCTFINSVRKWPNVGCQMCNTPRNANGATITIPSTGVH